ncbi:MAG: mechanosensitive ion channel [Deltaproteobacteria bacterium]
MFDFVSQLDDFFLAVLRHIQGDFRNEAVTAAALGVLLVLVLILHRKGTRFIGDREWRVGTYARFVVGLVFPLIYLLLVSSSSAYLKGEASVVFFHSLAYFYLGYFFIRSLLVPLRISFVPWNMISYLLLLLAVVFLMLTELNALYFKNEAIGGAFSLAFKVSVILLVYVFLLSGIKFLISKLPDRLKLAKSILENLTGFISIVYLIIAALWLFQILAVASSFFVGGVVVFIAILVYGFLNTYVATYLKPKIDAEASFYPGLAGNIGAFLNLTLLYVLFLILVAFFNLGYVASYLADVYIIRTEVVAISVLSLVYGLFVFFFLMSLVGILKHVIYFFNIKQNKELEAGSLRSLVANLGFLIALMVGLSSLGLTWTALLPVAGALGIGIGIGLQNIMNNYISGFILLFSKRLKIGDIIEIEGNAGRAVGSTLETIYGRVASIDTFSSVVTTTDGIEVVVPNSQFVEQQMVNYSLSDFTIRVRIPFGVSYSADPNTVKEILLRVADENTQILKSPAPGVWFSEYADSAIVFHLLLWVNIRNLWKVQPLISEMYFKVWYELEKAGIVIPFPQRDVWFKNNLQVEIEKEMRKDSEEQE